MRGNWNKVEIDATFSSNFLWQQNNFDFRSQETYEERLENNPAAFFFNHFEQTRGIVTKTGLIKSLTKYYENNPAAKKENYGVFDTTPTTFVITNCGDS